MFRMTCTSIYDSPRLFATGVLVHCTPENITHNNLPLTFLFLHDYDMEEAEAYPVIFLCTQEEQDIILNWY